jgi:hypothetical protein
MFYQNVTSLPLERSIAQTRVYARFVRPSFSQNPELQKGIALREALAIHLRNADRIRSGVY